MAPVRSVLSRGASLAQLAWIAVLTLVVTVSAPVDGPTMVVGAAIALVLLLAIAGHSARSRAGLPADGAAGPRREEKLLRGAFRRQSAPDTPGRPRPRAPGRVATAA
ncbi:DUF6412 domain-containing protein [Nocardia sp. CNY236]|uniref:DUF6412 domain-containing protein n=1 Tax=Nocardia sp. CNY236 TaxID=1169152 RepID=UPI000686B748|nr:DUF6412 domain-containing protein [Nocardia sp. CNY236]